MPGHDLVGNWKTIAKVVATADCAIWTYRNDPRVLVREGVNARSLTTADVPHPVTLVTIDVAFISLKHILPALPPFLERPSDVVALVKPHSRRVVMKWASAGW